MIIMNGNNAAVHSPNELHTVQHLSIIRWFVHAENVNVI